MVNPPEIPDGQGSLFETQLIGNGITEPADYRVTAELTPAPDGVYAENKADPTTEPVLEDTEVLEAIRAEIKTRHRQIAQTGKHSPLQREGSYLAVQPGDVLPAFGVVTHSNFRAAQQVARKLENQRVARPNRGN